MQRGLANYILIVIVLVLVATTAVGVLFWKNNSGLSISKDGNQIACTQEAKICPDGSSVDRSGPKCEFTACPSTAPLSTASSFASQTNWQKYTDDEGKYSIFYPTNYQIDHPKFYPDVQEYPVSLNQLTLIPPSTPPSPNFVIYIAYFYLPLNYTQNDVLNKIAACDKSNEIQSNPASLSRPFKFGNLEGIVYENSNCAQFSAANFYVFHADRAYKIEIDSTKPYSDHAAQVEDILMTFNFN